MADLIASGVFDPSSWPRTYEVELVREGVVFDSIDKFFMMASSWKEAFEVTKEMIEGLYPKTRIMSVRRVI